MASVPSIDTRSRWQSQDHLRLVWPPTASARKTAAVGLQGALAVRRANFPGQVFVTAVPKTGEVTPTMSGSPGLLPEVSTVKDKGDDGQGYTK